MKKMIWALACAASAGVLVADDFADNLISFESYGVPFTGLSENNDQGVKQSPQYWLYTGTDVADSSTVKAYAGSEVGTPACANPSKFPTGVGNNYLELSTEGGTLWRSANTIETVAAEWQLGASVTVPETGLYMDTLVQFTPTEDDSNPDLDQADKLAIWLDVNASGETNLVARGLQVTVQDDLYHAEPFTFKLVHLDGSSVVINPTAWYRLTVKSLNLAALEDGVDVALDGYQIYLDGVQLKPEQTVYSEEIINALNDNVNKELLQDNTVVQSLKGKNGNMASATFQAIGFRGTGAIDCLAVTADNPLVALPDVPFTITAAAGQTVQWSANNGTSWNDYATGAQASPGTLLIKLTTSDGGVKIVRQTLAAASNSFDVSAETFGWPEYLGEADSEGAFVIDDLAELNKFAAKYQTLGTSGVTFKLGADIALTSLWAGIGTYNSTTDFFAGTFDGQGHKISNVVMAPGAVNNYRGFFNQIDGGTVKNLTVESSGFGANPPTGEYGSAAIVGSAYNALIENCVSEGTVASATHNAGGIAIRLKNATVKNCTNKANITGNYTKVAGIAVLNQSGSSTIEGCRNEGTITAAGNAETAGRDGLAGILAYSDNVGITIKDCSNVGTLVKGTGANPQAKVGQIIGFRNAGTVTLQGTLMGTTAQLMFAQLNGAALNRHFATVTDNTASLIADSEVVAGGSYLAMVPNGTITLAQVGDSITLDTSLTSATVTTPEPNTVEVVGHVYTVKGAATADWPDDTALAALDDAATADTIGITDDELKTLPAKKLATWAKANGVSFAGGAPTVNKEAYLLNVANTADAVVAAKANFKILSITVAADGTVSVANPTGTFNGTISIKGATSVDATDWHPTQAGDRFFKAYLVP